MVRFIIVFALTMSTSLAIRGQEQLPAATIGPSDGVAKIWDADGSHSRVVAAHTQAPVFHGDKVRVESGAISITYNDGKVALLRGSGKEKRIYRHWSKAELSMVRSFEEKYKIAGRSRSGGVFSFPFGEELPASKFVIVPAFAGSGSMQTTITYAGKPIFRDTSPVGRLDSPKLRSAMASARGATDRLVTIHLTANGRHAALSALLMPSVKELELSRQIAQANAEPTVGLRALGRAAAYAHFGLHEFAAFELVRAKTLGVTSGFPNVKNLGSLYLENRIRAVDPG